MSKYFRFVSTNVLFWGLNTVSFIIITPLAVRVMGNALYGLWIVLLSIVLVASNIGTLGMLHVTNKFASQLPEDDLPQSKYLGSILLSAMVILLPTSLLAAAVLLLSRPVITNLLRIPTNVRDDFYNALLWGAIALMPVFLSRAPAGVLLGQLHNGVVRGLEVGGNLLLWGGAVLIAWLGYGINYTAQWMLVLNSISLLLYLWALRCTGVIVLPLKLNTSLLHKMLHFSFFTFLETIAVALFQQMDRVLVGFTLGPAAAGVYAIATSVGLRITMVAKQFTAVMIPYASLQESARAHAVLYRAFRGIIKYTSLLSGTLTGVLILWMDVLLAVWISPAYSVQYTALFRTIVLAYGLFTLAHPGRQTLLGMGRMRFVGLVYLVVSGGMLTVLYILTKHIGLIGAALANFVMALLVLFNLRVYSILTRRWRSEAVSDMFWGSVLAGGAYLLALPLNTWGGKLLGTFLLGVVAFVVAIRDQFLLSHAKTYGGKLLISLRKRFNSL